MKISYFKDWCSNLEIVFVGLFQVFVCLKFLDFFFLAAKLIGPFPGCQFFKDVDFFDYGSLNKNFLHNGLVFKFGDSFCRVVFDVLFVLNF